MIQCFCSIVELLSVPAFSDVACSSFSCLEDVTSDLLLLCDLRFVSSAGVGVDVGNGVAPISPGVPGVCNNC